MRTRYIFAKDPIIFHKTGVILDDDETPSVMTLRTFFNGVIDSLFVKKNPASRHICSDLCWQNAQVIISAKDKGEPIGKAVSRNGFQSKRRMISHTPESIRKSLQGN